MTAENAPLDENILEQLTEDLGRARADELLGGFAAATQRRMARIEAAAAGPDLGELHNEGHALKGSAASYGALPVAREADRLAAACHAGETETALDRVAALRDLVIAVVAACKARIAESDDPGPVSS